ncbi:MAG: response regulator transcription factor [Chitinophagaceae bacterium]|nr:MAG: response regulator transcription factor [Chitinophagaceae bacterium]
MATGLRLKVASVDDHRLFRKGLLSLLEMVSTEIEVLFEADNGKDMQQKIDANNLPSIILMDISMPEMDGFQSVAWLNKHHPSVKVLVVSMVENEESVIRMLKLGVKGYLSKDVEPQELGNALSAIDSRGFYYTDFITGKLVHTLQQGAGIEQEKAELALTAKEKTFLEMACSEMTYNDIATAMFLSPKTVDGYRNTLFAKLKVKSRVGLALYAVKHGYIKL